LDLEINNNISLQTFSYLIRSFIMQIYSLLFEAVLSISERVMTLLDFMKDLLLAMILHNEREYVTHRSSRSFTEFRNFYKELRPFLNHLGYNCAARGHHCLTDTTSSQSVSINLPKWINISTWGNSVSLVCHMVFEYS